MAASSEYVKSPLLKNIILVTDNGMDGHLFSFLAMMATELKPFGYDHFLGDTPGDQNSDQLIALLEVEIRKIHEQIIPCFEQYRKDLHEQIGCIHPPAVAHVEIGRYIKNRIANTREITELSYFKALALFIKTEWDAMTSLQTAIEEFTTEISQINLVLLTKRLQFWQTLQKIDIQYTGFRDPGIGDQLLANTRAALFPEAGMQLASSTSAQDEKKALKQVGAHIFEKLRASADLFITHVDLLTLAMFRTYHKQDLGNFLVVYVQNLPADSSRDLQMPAMFPPVLEQTVAHFRRTMYMDIPHLVTIDGKGKTQEQVAESLIKNIQIALAPPMTRLLNTMEQFLKIGDRAFPIREGERTPYIAPKPDLRPTLRITRHTQGIILGDSGAGKTALMLQMGKGQFLDTLESTICVAFHSLPVDRTHRAGISDVSGAEKYRDKIFMYTRSAQICFIAFDVCKSDAFARLEFWLNMVKTYVRANTPIILVGTQIDREDERLISSEDIKQFATTWNTAAGHASHRIHTSIETSAKTRAGLADFLSCISQCPEPASLKAPTISGSLFSTPPIKGVQTPPVQADNKILCVML